MSGSSKIAISWADLPKELLDKISKCLHTETDLRRFRAVCNSWRSSTTPFKKFPNSPLNLPLPFADGDTRHPRHDGAYLSLIERTVYRVQPPNCRDPNFWLVKIETSRDGKSRILNPVSDHEIKLLPETKMLKVFNTLDFRVSEVCKSYTLDYVNPSKPNKKYRYKLVKKVAVSAGANIDEYVIIAINYRGEPWYIKSGDKKWTRLGVHDFSQEFHDIVNYKGQFYGVDEYGDVYIFDSMLEEQSTASSEQYSCCKWHLVELFNGELILVAEFVEDGDDYKYRPEMNIAYKFIIWRFDKRREDWFEAEIKFDGIIFLGDDCSFSFSAKEFRKGCKGTRVFYSDRYICFRTEGEKKPHLPNYRDYRYYYNYFVCYCCDPREDTEIDDNFVPSDEVKLKFRGLNGHSTGVCDYATGKLGSLLNFPEFSDIFWPPPSWLLLLIKCMP